MLLKNHDDKRSWCCCAKFFHFHFCLPSLLSFTLSVLFIDFFLPFFYEGRLPFSAIPRICIAGHCYFLFCLLVLRGIFWLVGFKAIYHFSFQQQQLKKRTHSYQAGSVTFQRPIWSKTCLHPPIINNQLGGVCFFPISLCWKQLVCVSFPLFWEVLSFHTAGKRFACMQWIDLWGTSDSESPCPECSLTFILRRRKHAPKAFMALTGKRSACVFFLRAELWNGLWRGVAWICIDLWPYLLRPSTFAHWPFSSVLHLQVRWNKFSFCFSFYLSRRKYAQPSRPLAKVIGFLWRYMGRQTYVPRGEKVFCCNETLIPCSAFLLCFCVFRRRIFTAKDV